MKDRFIALLQKHHSKNEGEIATIFAEISALVEAGGGRPSNELIRRVHTLKGTSGSMGYDRIYAATRRVEAALRVYAKGADPELLPVLLERTSALRDVSGTTEMTDSSLLQKFD